MSSSEVGQNRVIDKDLGSGGFLHPLIDESDMELMSVTNENNTGDVSKTTKKTSSPKNAEIIEKLHKNRNHSKINGTHKKGETNGGINLSLIELNSMEGTSRHVSMDRSTPKQHNGKRHSEPLINGQMDELRRNGNDTDLMMFRHLKQTQKVGNENGNIPHGTFIDRDKPFTNKLDFFGIMMSYLLGVGNVIRFSQLCHKNGGAFFIPYIIMLILEGIPLLCLEMAVGQRFGKVSLTKAWSDLGPNLTGLGFAAIAENTFCLFYYNIIVTWCLYYFIQSLRDSLLWEPCPTMTSYTGNMTIKTENLECRKAGPEKYFWYRKSLNVSDDINSSLGLNMFMYVFVFLAWTSAWLLTMRGIRRSSKIMWAILLLIIVELIIFFFLAVHLKGWAQGLAMLFSFEKMDKLKDIKVWMAAAGQIFYSMGIGYGSNILFSSRNKHNSNFYVDAIICSLANSGTSIWASIIMFSFFGFRMQYKEEKCLSALNSNSSAVISSFMMSANIEGNATAMGLVNGTNNCSKRFFFEQLPEGMSLVFVGMSQAFGEIKPGSTIWAALFFLLLFLLGTSSVPGMLHVLANAFIEFRLVPKNWGRQTVCGVICLVFCLSNLVFVQSMGLYLLEIIDSASGFPLLIIGFCECVGLCYVYGLDKFSKDVELMTGSKPAWKWKICWKFISPVIILGVIVGGVIDMVQSGEKTYTAWDQEKGQTTKLPYPPWAYVLYIFVLFVPILCLLYPFFKMCFTKLSIGTIMQRISLDCGSCKAIYEAYRKRVRHRRSGSYNVTAALSGEDYIARNGLDNNGVELHDSMGDRNGDMNAQNTSTTESSHQETIRDS